MGVANGSSDDAKVENGERKSQDQVEMRMIEVVHKVVLPPPRSTLEKLKLRLKETFFPDDPFRRFKGRPLKIKWLLAIQYLFPIIDWLPTYSFSLFKSDLVSGLTIASLAIPQGISYAKLADLPPIIGLYSSFVPPFVYAVLGSSRDLAVGPVSIASLIMGSMLSRAVNPNTNPDLFFQLAITSTFFAGLVQASLGVLRLGFIIDFLSKATLVGFMAGAAIIVSLQQLKSLLGIVHFTNQMGLVPVLSSVFHRTHEWSWQTVTMGICFLGLLLLARHISIRRPKLFWVSAGAPLTSVILSTLLMFIFKAQFHHISVIGRLERGLNPPSWSKLLLDGSYVGLVLKTGLVTGIISLTEGVAVGRTFASLKDYQVDGNKEMMAIGLMNIIGSFTSCYVTTGAFSRSAVNNNAGCKTAMSNIVMAVTVMVTLLFLMPLFIHTPNVVLAAIIITAVIGLIDLPAAYHIWKMDKTDFLVCLCAFLGVIFISVQDGLAIAVAISVFRILLQVTRPKLVTLGTIPGTDIYRNLNHYRDAKAIPGFLILAVEAPINFANTTYLKERVTRYIEEENEGGEKMTGLQFVILDLSGHREALSGNNGSLEASDSSLVVCFGEMLIDFVPTISGLSLAEAPAFKKAPGGAPANVAVGIARLGGSSAFIGKVGEDEFGYMLAEILKENNVNNEGMRFDPGARTALAFVTLRKDGEREFMFYRNPSADMLLEEGELNLDIIRKAKIFHYGSISLITEPCKSAHIAAAKAAKDAGVLLSYDPNLRLPLWPSAERAREGIFNIWDIADIIKISEEEVSFLTNGEDPYDDAVVRKLFHPNLKLLLVTEGPNGCRYYSKDFSGRVSGLKVDAVDTTGAGDAFVAGTLSQLAADISLLQDESRLREVLKFANACGALTVMERGAIPALPTREAVLNALINLVA